MIKRFFAALAMVAGLSGVFVATAAPPASAAVCVTLYVTIAGNQVIAGPRVCIPPT